MDPLSSVRSAEAYGEGEGPSKRGERALRDARTSWNTRTVPSVTPTYTRSPLGAGAAAMGPKVCPRTTDTFTDHRTAHVPAI
jgi:hypothetical protein